MFDLVEDLALNNDIDALIRFQNRSIGEDEAIVRLAKSRAYGGNGIERMWSNDRRSEESAFAVRR